MVPSSSEPSVSVTVISCGSPLSTIVAYITSSTDGSLRPALSLSPTMAIGPSSVQSTPVCSFLVTPTVGPNTVPSLSSTIAVVL